MSLNFESSCTYKNQIQFAQERITKIFNQYLDKNENNQRWSWYNTVKTELPAFQEFIRAERGKKITIDDIKEYVLTISEKFTDYIPWALGLEGNSDLKNNLITEVHSWPKYVELLEKENETSFLQIKELQGEKVELEKQNDLLEMTKLNLIQQCKTLMINYDNLQEKNKNETLKKYVTVKNVENNSKNKKALLKKSLT